MIPQLRRVKGFEFSTHVAAETPEYQWAEPYLRTDEKYVEPELKGQFWPPDFEKKFMEAVIQDAKSLGVYGELIWRK